MKSFALRLTFALVLTSGFVLGAGPFRVAAGCGGGTAGSDCKTSTSAPAAPVSNLYVFLRAVRLLIP